MKAAIVSIALLLSTPAFAGGRTEKADAAKRAWSQCVQDSIAKWSASSERTDTLMRAAFGRCQPKQDAYRAAYRNSTRDYGVLDPDSDEEIDAKVTQTEDAIKAEALASLLDARVDATAKAPTP